jgi:hypothetical protein
MLQLSDNQEEALELFRQRLPIGLRHELNNILDMGKASSKRAALLRPPESKDSAGFRETKRARHPYEFIGIGD